jgi:predicted dehydrogenase
MSTQPAKVRWGILGVASVALRRTIPGLKKSQLCEVAAIASRDLARARAAAAHMNIPRAYGSYEQLLADPDVDAV